MPELTTTPRYWNDINYDYQLQLWAVFADVLQPIGIAVEEATAYFNLDYEHATTIYTNNGFTTIFYMVYQTNLRKYNMMIDAYIAEYDPISNYDMTETSTDTRTPNLSVAATQSLNTSIRSTGTQTNGISSTVENTGTQTNGISSTIENTGTQTDGISSTVNNTGTQTTDIDNTQSRANNQTKTTIDTPNNYTDTTTHTVDPYDGSGLRNEYVDTSVRSGSTQTAESYSGQPDTTIDDGTTLRTDNLTQTTTGTNTRTDDLTQTTTGTNTRTDNLTQTTTGTNTRTDDLTQATTGTNTNNTLTTGTDTNTHTLTRRGNIGVTTSQQMLESQLALAAKMNIFKVIERDIAQKLFLQVW